MMMMNSYKMLRPFILENKSYSMRIVIIVMHQMLPDIKCNSSSTGFCRAEYPFSRTIFGWTRFRRSSTFLNIWFSLSLPCITKNAWSPNFPLCKSRPLLIYNINCLFLNIQIDKFTLILNCYFYLVS